MINDAQKEKMLVCAAKGYSIETFIAEEGIRSSELADEMTHSLEFRDHIDKCIALQQLFWEAEAQKFMASMDDFKGGSKGLSYCQFMLNKIYAANSLNSPRKGFMKGSNKKEKRETFIADTDEDEMERIAEILAKKES